MFMIESITRNHAVNLSSNYATMIFKRPPHSSLPRVSLQLKRNECSRYNSSVCVDADPHRLQLVFPDNCILIHPMLCPECFTFRIHLPSRLQERHGMRILSYEMIRLWMFHIFLTAIHRENKGILYISYSNISVLVAIDSYSWSVIIWLINSVVIGSSITKKKKSTEYGRNILLCNISSSF